MKKMIGIGAIALVVALYSGPAFAAEAAALYKAKCAPCHGAEGVGTAMAPAHKGNAWIKDNSETQIADVIRNGREGAAKKYKQFAIGMPAQKNLPDADIKELVAYLKTLAAK